METCYCIDDSLHLPWRASSGAGGLGDVAIRYGYQRWEPNVMVTCVILLILSVQLVQSVGTLIAKKLRKR